MFDRRETLDQQGSDLRHGGLPRDLGDQGLLVKEIKLSQSLRADMQLCFETLTEIASNLMSKVHQKAQIAALVLSGCRLNEGFTASEILDLEYSANRLEDAAKVTKAAATISAILLECDTGIFGHGSPNARLTSMRGDFQVLFSLAADPQVNTVGSTTFVGRSQVEPIDGSLKGLFNNNSEELRMLFNILQQASGLPSSGDCD